MFKITKNLISWLFLLLWITKNYCQYGSYNIISVEAINEENINERFESRTLTSCYLRCQANPNCDRVAYQYESAAKDLITCYLIKNVATDSSLNVIKAHVITPYMTNEVDASKEKVNVSNNEASGGGKLDCSTDSLYAITFTQRSITIPYVTKTMSFVDAMTITVWIKVTELPVAMTCPVVVSFLPPGDTSCNDISVAMSTGSPKMRGYTYPRSGDMNAENKLHEWVHVAILYDGTKNSQDFYINGTKTRSMSWEEVKTRTVDQIQVTIGSDVDKETDCVINDIQQSFVGSVANLFVWKRLLTSDEIMAAYKNQPNTTDAIVLWHEFRSKVDGVSNIIEPFQSCL